MYSSDHFGPYSDYLHYSYMIVYRRSLSDLSQLALCLNLYRTVIGPPDPCQAENGPI